MRMEGTRNTEHMSTVLCQEAWSGRVPDRATLIRDGALDSAGQESSWREGNGRRTKSSFPA